ncbi:MAG: FtsX-like permease family protein [Bdellovibrionales bacterium]|nr:FtsX-like permease family protein [Bdellovibrionales bacterium]
MMRLKIAVRNITRHRLRSFLSIGMIAGAVTAVILFQGFSEYSLHALKIIAAENQFGHMQIANKKYWSPGKESRAEKLFTLNDLNDLKGKFPQVVSLSGRLSFFGLISNGDLSVGGKMIGVDPQGEPLFYKSMKITAGNFFDNKNNKEVIVGRLLAKQMNVVPGDDITILTNTIDGVMNAMDLKITGIFSAGIDEVDGQVVYLPLSVTQEILDTKQVDIGVLKFKELPMAEDSLAKINATLKTARPNLIARSWRELAVLFRQVDKFYGVQNRLIEAILLALMFLGILNTVSMTVVERTGEIGTLRALGESQRDIISQFVLESSLIAIIGIILGLASSILLINVVDTVKIMTEMPGASTPFQIKIYFLTSSVVYAGILAATTTIIATVIPALRASRMDIVEALRKNI